MYVVAALREWKRRNEMKARTLSESPSLPWVVPAGALKASSPKIPNPDETTDSLPSTTTTDSLD
jgi:hypothetical protein